MKTLKIAIVALLSLLVMANHSCETRAPSADKSQKQRVEMQQRQAEKAVPPPRITKFTQLRDAVRVQEIADSNISTWAYYMDMHGKLHFLCEAKGYGLPYSTQTTNPQKIGAAYSQGGFAVLPQPEPSALFMPDNVAATWVLCARPDGEGFDAVYWEPDLVVSPFPLQHTGELRAAG